MQSSFRQEPISGSAFPFRGRGGDRIKPLFWDGRGFCLYYKVLEKGGDLDIPPPFARFLVQSDLRDLQGMDDAWAAWVLGFGRALSAVERGARPFGDGQQHHSVACV